jgi:hypothetical protein
VSTSDHALSGKGLDPHWIGGRRREGDVTDDEGAADCKQGETTDGGAGNEIMAGVQSERGEVLRLSALLGPGNFSDCGGDSAAYIARMAHPSQKGRGQAEAGSTLVHEHQSERGRSAGACHRR